MAKGHKTCPACNRSVGCRSHHCECGHSFATAIAGTEEHRNRNEPEFFPVSGNEILTPAGKCPVPFRGDLREWTDRLQDEAAKEGNYFGVSAFRYWLRGLVSPSEFTQLSAALNRG